MATTPVPVNQTAPAPTPATADPWRSFRTEMDRLFDRFLGGGALAAFPTFGAGIPLAAPAVDIAEDDQCFRFSAELPGMTEKEIEVSLAGDTLTVKGEKHHDREEKRQDYHLKERSYGTFRRAFLLPSGVDGGKAEAAFTNGVLTVTVPKASQAKPTRIEVKAA